MVSRDGDPERESDGQSASNDGDGLSAAVDHHALYRARHDGRMRRLEAVALIRVRLPERRKNCSGRLDRRTARAARSSRPEAIRLALKDWLTGLGLLKAGEDPEGAN